MKSVVVVGGSGGIGRAVVSQLSGANYEVFNIDKVKPEKLMPYEIFLKTDVLKEKALIKSISKIRSSAKNLYSLIYTAGIGGEFRTITNVPTSEWDEIMGVNLKGVYICLREMLEDFARKKMGRIVVISSLFSLKGGKNSAAYSASKHGIVGLVKSIADEWGEYGITCNSIGPGYVRTKMGIQEKKVKFHEKEILKKTPVKRIASPYEIARAVMFLISEDSGYVNGANWMIDGGMSAI